MHYAANSDALGKKLEHYAANSDALGKKLEHYAANSDALGKKLEHYDANSDTLGKKLEHYAANMEQHAIRLGEHTVLIEGHTAQLEVHNEKLEAYTHKIEGHNARLAELTERQEQHNVRLEEHSSSLRYFADRLDKEIAESRADRKRMNKAWGDLANKMGTVAEDVVAPNIPRLARNEFGMARIEDMVVRAHRTSRRQPERLAEYDIVCAGPRTVIVVEVKSNPTVDKVRELPRKLREFHDFYPEYEGRTLIGVFASWSIPENLLRPISKAGLYGIAMGDETMEVVARPG